MKKKICEENGGKSLQDEGAQKAPELLVSQALAKEKEAKKEKLMVATRKDGGENKQA